MNTSSIDFDIANAAIGPKQNKEQNHNRHTTTTQNPMTKSFCGRKQITENHALIAINPYRLINVAIIKSLALQKKQKH